MHLVHYNSIYPNLSTAAEVTDGLAVLGFMFHIQDKDNDALDFLLDELTNVSKKNSVDQLSAKPAIMDMLKGVDLQKYVRYSGSLTTPGCYESVQWTVFTDTIPISEMQMNSIRNTYLDNGTTLIGHNYRPTQDLNGRNVSRSFNITGSSEWDYHSDTNGPSHWTGICATGQKQSPIKIDITSTVYDNKLGSFTFTNYNASNEYSTVFNNGHTIQVNMDDDSVGITGGGLVPGFYKLVQFHFHWSSSSDEGSEHWIDNEQYPMELHLVHYNAMYPDLSSAVQDTDGLAVLGFLFHINKEDNHDLDFLFDELANVSYKGSVDGLTTKPAIMNMLKVVDLKKYVRYSGSLTTPGCYESVQWTVFTDTIPISETQMNEIRNTYLDAGTTKIEYNYRPTQSLNGRTVARSYIIPATNIRSNIKPTTIQPSNSAIVLVYKNASWLFIFQAAFFFIF